MYGKKSPIADACRLPFMPTLPQIKGSIGNLGGGSPFDHFAATTAEPSAESAHGLPNLHSENEEIEEYCESKSDRT